MRLETHYRETPGYLVAKISGSWMEQNAKDAIEEVSGEARRRGLTKVLLDLSDLSGPDTEMTRFYSGEHIAKMWRPPLRVAAVGPAELINRFAENVAKNRGALFSLFTDEESALRWLLPTSDVPMGRAAADSQVGQGQVRSPGRLGFGVSTRAGCRMRPHAPPRGCGERRLPGFPRMILPARRYALWAACAVPFLLVPVGSAWSVGPLARCGVRWCNALMAGFRAARIRTRRWSPPKGLRSSLHPRRPSR
jgi:hypothetical protein